MLFLAISEKNTIAGAIFCSSVNTGLSISMAQRSSRSINELVPSTNAEKSEGSRSIIFLMKYETNEVKVFLSLEYRVIAKLHAASKSSRIAETL